ncbi:hypothetical protein SD70_10405 [Gordoniibacillus kamchatkensis]|uniref:HAMP domain-containing protein n=1 Tax=Gordoniibacillus kamchatkensis TaxID=1590651 RepID=A0ABR5AIG2_9BACL|nr:histidine kinase [Paenibacillus sp. VKM B-2647]KIL40845.1 hypothetical protein SD70_10405 [Paenibacillus sp. VKM B-2647]
MHKHSLRFKLVSGFLLILVPLALFLFYNNYEAMRIVREEVSQSIGTALSLHVSEIDKSLEETDYYLLRQITSDASYPYLVTLWLYPAESGDYFLAKQTMLNKMKDDINTYKIVDTLFVYNAKNDDLIATQRTYETNRRNEELVRQFMKQSDATRVRDWLPASYNGKNYLVRVEKATDTEIWVGAIVDVEPMLAPLQTLDFGAHWKSVLLTSAGKPLTQTNVSASGLQEIRRQLQQGISGYRVFRDGSGSESYLLTGANFRFAPLSLAALVPEKEKLQQLPFFQRVIVLIPIGALVVLVCYSYFLKRVLLVPMNALIVGMRRMMMGNFDIRLKVNNSTELKFLIETFNTMVSQIRNLKINVYEEKLKAQEAEFKHLQAQINPHFYLNSLNVIHSLSLLGENRLVERMAEHLADYFRFITRSHRESITLEEELEHIRNYLDIQALRFHDKLAYNIDLPEQFRSCRVLPLSLQPFVENAIVHGMDKGKSVFRVDIAVRAAAEGGNCMEVEIADNGKGFPPELLARFRSGDFGTGTTKGRLGIWNVLNRLRMKFGDA